MWSTQGYGESRPGSPSALQLRATAPGRVGVHLLRGCSSPANRIIPIITAPPPPAPALGTRVTSGVPLPHRAIQWNDSLLCKPFMKVKCPAHKSPADSIAFPSNSFWASQALLTSRREGGLWSRQIVLWRKLMLLTTKSTSACIIFFDL